MASERGRFALQEISFMTRRSPSGLSATLL